MQQANVIIAATQGPSMSCQSIDWRLVNRRVNNLRKRIYRASLVGDTKLAGSLQKLMLKSTSNKLLAIRRVTQVNQGRNSPGVDKVVVNTEKERRWLLEELSKDELSSVKPVRRVCIPKQNGKVRKLGLPTILYRCREAVVKSALEPYWEARLEPCSYGFRPGRNTHDAIQKIFCIARPGKSRRWTLAVDIKGAFDHINHDLLIKEIGNFPARHWIRAWLETGVMEKVRIHPTKAGTPQGGIVSPLLANIAFHGMEKALGINYDSYGRISAQSTYALVRYADDSIVLAKTRAACKTAQKQLKAWLKPRGLELSEGKTHIRSIEQGVNFLGFNIKQYKTSKKEKGKESISTFKQGMVAAWKKGLLWTPQQVIEYINPKIKGWVGYFRTGTSKKFFSDLDHWMWQRQAWYTVRKHPDKSWQWRINKYWGKIKERNDRWVFMDKENEKELYLWKLAWTPIKRHILVKGGSSPDDPQLGTYWKERQAKPTNQLSKIRIKLWKKQRGKCIVCSGNLDNGEPIEVHHLLEKRLGGTDCITNLSILHTTCHKQAYSKKGRQTTDVSKLLEPYAG